MKLLESMVLDVGMAMVIVLGLSSWLGRVWASRMMQSEIKQIEQLKSKLTQEVEAYKGRLRKSELLFDREVAAASSLVAMIVEIDSGYADPWMDDIDTFCEQYLCHNLEVVHRLLSGFIGTHGGVLPPAILELVEAADIEAIQGSFDPVPRAERPADFARRCYERLLTAKAELLRHVHGAVDPTSTSASTLVQSGAKQPFCSLESR